MKTTNILPVSGRLEEERDRVQGDRCCTCRPCLGELTLKTRPERLFLSAFLLLLFVFSIIYDWTISDERPFATDQGPETS